jgi:hypothetical protein
MIGGRKASVAEQKKAPLLSGMIGAGLRISPDEATHQNSKNPLRETPSWHCKPLAIAKTLKNKER